MNNILRRVTPLRLILLAALWLHSGVSLGQDTDQALSVSELQLSTLECATFEQERYLADFDVRINSTGYIKRLEQGIEWRTLSPIEDSVILGAQDNGALSTAQEIMAPLMQAVLSGDWRALEDYFTVQLSGTPGRWQASLLPHQSALAEHLDSIQLSGATTVTGAQLQFVNKDSIDIALQVADCQSLGGAR